MSAQHTPGPRVGIQRLTPVCEASNVPYDNYGSTVRKDADNRAPCPICRKVVKLRKVSGHGPWPNTIPHHHMGKIAGAAYVDSLANNGNPYPAGSSRAEAWDDGFMGRPMQWCAAGSNYAKAYRGGERAAIAKATGEPS